MFSCTGKPLSVECDQTATSSNPWPIASGQISTVNSFSFLYGRVEVRAQLPNAHWVFPQIFLQPLENIYGSENYASGQMRLAHSAAGESMIGGVVLDAEPPFRVLKMCLYNGHWADDFHVFALHWTPGWTLLTLPLIHNQQRNYSFQTKSPSQSMAASSVCCALPSRMSALLDVVRQLSANGWPTAAILRPLIVHSI